MREKLLDNNTRKRFLLYSFLILILMILSFYVLKVYSSYNSNANINTKVEKAIYLLKEEELSFNIDIDGIAPSDDPYIYSFSIANYDGDTRSNVDLEYRLNIRTTTNLPVRYELYRNEEYDLENSINLFDSSYEKQDEDGSWYRVFKMDSFYTFNYKEKMKDIYYLVVYFPMEYKSDTSYSDSIDLVEVDIYAQQIID